MDGKGPQQKFVDWGSGQVMFTAREGDIDVRLIIGYILGPSRLDDLYLVDFSFKRKVARSKNTVEDIIRIHNHFSDWDDVIFWVSEIATAAAMLLYIKNEFAKEYISSNKEIRDRIKSCVDYIGAQLEDQHKKILQRRENPELAQSDGNEKNKIKPH